MSDDRAALREQLAALMHEQWRGWMGHMAAVGHVDTQGRWVLPAASAARWQRQMQTPYAELSESEKGSDRQEADRVLALIVPVVGRLTRQRDQARAVARYRSGFGDDAPADLEPGDDDGWSIEP